MRVHFCGISKETVQSLMGWKEEVGWWQREDIMKHCHCGRGRIQSTIWACAVDLHIICTHLTLRLPYNQEEPEESNTFFHLNGKKHCRKRVNCAMSSDQSPKWVWATIPLNQTVWIVWKNRWVRVGLVGMLSVGKIQGRLSTQFTFL